MAHPEFGRRAEATRALRDQAAGIVRACADMAERFRRGGTLYVLGAGPAASDAQHVAVEFVHPVLVGKRALPSRYLSSPRLLPLHARDGDVALVVAPTQLDHGSLAALNLARGNGVLTVALVVGDDPCPGVDHELRAHGDPLVGQEMQVTTYHLLWELVHVHLEHGDLVPAAALSPVCSTDGHCVTCADEAVPVQVLELLGDGLALVDTGSGTEEVSVALVDARAGDTVLVHAREAIAVVHQ